MTITVVMRLPENEMRSYALVLKMLLALGASSEALSQPADIDRCNDILKQDMFDRFEKSNSNTSAERLEFRAKLFSLSDEAALTQYQKAYESTVNQGTSGSGGWTGPYGVFDLEVNNTYGRKLTDNEFKEAFKKRKQELQTESSNSSSRSSELIAVERSTSRNAASVQAWERCMLRTEKPGLYAYGYRDASGDPFIVVMWLPGEFASTFPSVAVRFPQQGDGITIVGTKSVTRVASGSGTSFPIRFKSDADRRGKSDGFTVLVNGELAGANLPVNSFRAEAVIPKYIGPVDCGKQFTAGRTVQYAVQGAPNEKLEWMSALMSMDPSGQGRRLIADVRNPKSRISLEMNGATTVISVLGRDSQGRERSAPMISIDCTSLGPIATPSSSLGLPGSARAYVRVL